MANNKLKIALIGAGVMGTKHAVKILQSKNLAGELSFVVEPSRTSLKKFKSIIGAKKSKQITFVTSFGELIEKYTDQFQAAIVVVPSKIHFQCAEALLKIGKHCLVEKPLGFSVSECKALDNLANKNKAILQVGMLERWNLGRLWQEWRPDFKNFHLVCARKSPFVERAADVDVVYDMMIHDIDCYMLLERVFKLPPIKSIRSYGRKVRSDKFDFAHAELKLEDGSIIVFHSTRLSPVVQRTWSLVSGNWHATVDFLNRELVKFERKRSNSKDFNISKNKWRIGDPLLMEIEAFVQRINGNYQSRFKKQSISRFCQPEELIPSGHSVLRTHEIVDKIFSKLKSV